jgi:sugar phosphate isomerase/epimerase
MRLGIFAKTFARPSFEAALDAVQAHGLDCVQFNMACAGLPSLPAEIPTTLAARVRRALTERKIEMAAVSGTFNMIHPDRETRREGLRRLRTLALSCAVLGTRIITLCTGTRDPDNMWRHHADNNTPAAWDDLQESMSSALAIAEEADVTLAFEPETANVVDSVSKAADLQRAMHSLRLKVVIDPANLFHRGEIFRMHEILQEAFTILGPDIVLAHAKDIDAHGKHVTAGTGLLDYDCYLEWLRKIDFKGPLIMHGLEEAEVGECLTFLRKKTIGYRLPRT